MGVISPALGIPGFDVGLPRVDVPLGADTSQHHHTPGGQEISRGDRILRFECVSPVFLATVYMFYITLPYL